MHTDRRIDTEDSKNRLKNRNDYDSTTDTKQACQRTCNAARRQHGRAEYQPIMHFVQRETAGVPR